jgi:hypothetical protein
VLFSGRAALPSPAGEELGADGAGELDGAEAAVDGATVAPLAEMTDEENATAASPGEAGEAIGFASGFVAAVATCVDQE